MSDIRPHSDRIRRIKCDEGLFTVKQKDRLFPLLALMHDTYIDDLSDERLAQLEELVDSWRITHGDGERFRTVSEPVEAKP